MAFKIAGSLAFREAYAKADPVMLEPVMAVEISVPEDSVGDITGDLNSRRGRLLGIEPRGSATTVRAEVPMAEMLTYSPDAHLGDRRARRLRDELPPLRGGSAAHRAEGRRRREEGGRIPLGLTRLRRQQSVVHCDYCERTLLLGESVANFRDGRDDADRVRPVRGRRPQARVAARRPARPAAAAARAAGGADRPPQAAPRRSARRRSPRRAPRRATRSASSG